MAHKVLIGGTAYSVSSGRSMVSGTTYDIKGGRTLVDGTGYSISFSSGEPTAMLYSDGDMVFQYGSDVASGKTLTASYTWFENESYFGSGDVPWKSNMNNIKRVNFNNEIKPVGIAHWFHNAKNITSFNWTNFKWNKAIDMTNAFYSCTNLTSSPACGDVVVNMTNAYYGCTNLTGSPACGNNVVNMSYAYYGCRNLTGSPVCGDNVVNMYRTYYGCANLTGSPVCGDKVTSMAYAYANCTNLTGSPVCGDKVTSMLNAYANCTNLTGSPVCGNNVTTMINAYRNCKNLNAGTFYFYAKNISNARNCFNGKNNSRRYNIHVPANSTTLNTFIINNSSSIIGKNITWTKSGSNYYNTTYNIYIYANTSMA